ncbi:hypothetical protein GmHk_17G049675 [Glycine max]|nr:hypothetical protein GmHk_17G049675 [Glycine max]
MTMCIVVKLTIAGKNIVKEEDFKVLTSEFVKDYDVSKNEVVEKLKSLTAEPRDNTYLRIVLVASGGHFADVVRAKAGKKQSPKDASGRAAHSAGGFTSENYTDTSIYTDSFSVDDPSENHTSIFFDAKGDGKDSEASFSNSTRPLTESEKSELIFKNHFLTILLPINRFAEMGPSSRTFFSHNGFTCLQVLDHIRAFYQENMSRQEIGAAIHSDSRHADRIRSMFKIPFYPNSSNPKLDFACSSLHNNKHHSNRYHF